MTGEIQKATTLPALRTILYGRGVSASILQSRTRPAVLRRPLSVQKIVYINREALFN